MLLNFILDLQQTPATSAKVMLKVFAQTQGAAASEQYVFSFTSPTTARAEADAIKDALGKAIQAAKAGSSVLAQPGGGSAAMTIASAVTSLPHGGNTDAWYDDSRLKSDVQLQQSLLKANPSLSKTFMESLRTKPELITTSQFTSQFWSTRIHLLRAHAIEKNQTRGGYNILSTIKVIPPVDDEIIKLNISKEQIQLIFNQHSLVKRVYDENVPRLSEEEFWARFFQSRLFKKLKGERIPQSGRIDPIIDKYLEYNDDEERGKRLAATHIPHIIDVEGNEENHSQRKGNQPDLTMRPTSLDNVPIIRTLNTLSEKIMVHVPPNDIDPSLPIGVDEETFNTLALRDLQGDAEENRVILNVKDQSRFFSSNKETGVSTDAALYAKQDPVQVLRLLKTDLAHMTSSPGLESAIGVNNDSSDDESQPKKGHVGSRASLAAATTQILAAVSQQRTQTVDLHASAASFSTSLPSSTFGLSVPVFDRLSLTHATTTEFLQHFWSAFLSGDADRAEEISRLVETLNRAMDRIKAVSDDADQDRTKEVEKVKKQMRDHYERTQRKMKFDLDSIGGGAKVVNQLLGPTVKAIQLAGKEYKKALAAASAMAMEEDEIT